MFNIITALSASLIICGSNDTAIYCKTFANFNKIKKSFDQQKRGYYFTVGSFVTGETGGTPSKSKITLVARQNDRVGLIYTLTTKNATTCYNHLFK